jgi:hypothetical protein
MNDEPAKAKARIQLAVLALLGLLISAIAVCVLAFSSPRVDDNDIHTSEPWPVPEDEAIKIAIEEVKKREGWTGFVDRPVDRVDNSLEGLTWLVQVWRQPSPHSSSESSRVVVVNGATGKVRDHNTFATPLP